MKLINVKVKLDDAGWSVRSEEIEVTEKPKSYVGKHTRIDKEKIMRVDETMWRNGHSIISYQTWCFPEQKTTAVEMLTQSVKDFFDKVSTRVALLQHNIDNKIKTPY